MERRGSLIYFLLYIRQGKESVKLLGWGREGGHPADLQSIAFKAGR